MTAAVDEAPEEEQGEERDFALERVCLRCAYQDYWSKTGSKRKLDKDLARDLEPGWLWTYLLPLEGATWGRWNWWLRVLLCGGQLPEQEEGVQLLPQIVFSDTPEPLAQKVLSRALDSIPNHGEGSWLTMGAWEYFRYFLDWFLYGVGDPSVPELPRETVEGCCMRLYQTFDVTPLLLWPHDYLGNMLAQNAYGKRQGFFPTPHSVVNMMVQMTMGASEAQGAWASVCDAALGTGRMLLEASNYSLNLYGIDIDLTMCRAALVNAYLYAPWLAKPFAGAEALRCANALTDPWLEAQGDPRACAKTDDSDAHEQSVTTESETRAEATAEAATAESEDDFCLEIVPEMPVRSRRAGIHHRQK